MSNDLDWLRWPNFSADEFRCRHKGCVDDLKMDPEFLDKLQAVRTIVGFAMRINSGYRCPKHPVEAKKKTPGAHAFGIAADISCDGRQAFHLNKAAVQVGMTGIGFSQRKGRGRFIHLDIWDDPVRPNIWSY